MRRLGRQTHPRPWRDTQQPLRNHCLGPEIQLGRAGLTLLLWAGLGRVSAEATGSLGFQPGTQRPPQAPTPPPAELTPPPRLFTLESEPLGVPGPSSAPPWGLDPGVPVGHPPPPRALPLFIAAPRIPRPPSPPCFPTSQGAAESRRLDAAERGGTNTLGTPKLKLLRPRRPPTPAPLFWCWHTCPSQAARPSPPQRLSPPTSSFLNLACVYPQAESESWGASTLGLPPYYPSPLLSLGAKERTTVR